MTLVSRTCALEAAATGWPTWGTSSTLHGFPQLRGGVADAAGDGRKLPGYPVTYPKGNIMHWFGEGPETEDSERAHSQRDAGYMGWLDKHGHPIASRTDPKTGQALGFGDKGWDGKDTPDEARAGGFFSW